MSDTAPLPRRRGALRWIVVGLLSFGILGLAALLAYRHLQATLTEPAPRVTQAAATRAADLPPRPAAPKAEQAAKGAGAETPSPDRAAASVPPAGGTASSGAQVVTASPDHATPAVPPVSGSAYADAQVVTASPDHTTPLPPPPGRTASSGAGVASVSRDRTAPSALPAGGTASTSAPVVTASSGRTAPRTPSSGGTASVSARMVTASADRAKQAGSPAGGAAATEAPVLRPSFDIVRVAPSGSAVIAGRAAPDTDVTLLDNGREIGRAKADETGQFVVIPDQPLPAGGQELALQAEQSGTAPVTGDAPALLIVPARPEGHAPVAASPHEAPREKSGGAVAVLAPTDAAPRLLTVPAEPGGAPGQVALRVVDYDAHGTIRFAGTARPGTSVRLYIDNAPVGEASADSQGQWNLVPTGPVNTGEHRLRADDLGPRGQVLSRAELPFQRAAFGPDDLRTGQVVVQPRQSLWRIARHVYGHGMRYTVIYDANRDQIRDANRIYPGQIFTLPSAASAAVLPGRAAGGAD